MARKLENKVAVITGGNSGIGLATAKLFQAEGARVVITGRRQDVVDSAVKEIGGHSIGFKSNTSKLDDIAALYEKVKDQFGKIDILFLKCRHCQIWPLHLR